jgi:hypothetical protein
VLVCNWPYSVEQNHFFVMMLFNRDSAIQKCFQKILHSLQVRKFGSLPAFRKMCHTVRTPNCPKHHPFGRCDIPSGRSTIHSIIGADDMDFRSDLPLCREASNCSSLHPSRLSAARPDDTQCSTKLQDFFPKHKCGKIAATVWTMWIPVRMC